MAKVTVKAAGAAAAVATEAATSGEVGKAMVFPDDLAAAVAVRTEELAVVVIKMEEVHFTPFRPPT